MPESSEIFERELEIIKHNQYLDDLRRDLYWAGVPREATWRLAAQLVERGWRRS